MNTENRKRLKLITTTGVLSAVAVVLVLLVHFPILPSASFLEYDPANIPILLVTFMYGPLAGIVMTAIVAVLQGLIVSAQSGVYGVIMHFISTCALIIPAGIIYKRKRTKIGAVIALGVGTVSMVAVMIVANLIITPLFLGVPASAVWGMMFTAIVPFNLIKAVVNCVVAFIIYKPLKKLFKL